MLFKRRATYVLWVILDAEFDGDTHFKFDQRKGQLLVKLGQIRSNLKIQNFLTLICLYWADFSPDSKNAIYFYVWQLEMPKIAFQKCDVITLPVFLAFAQPKKDIALKFCMCVVCMYLDHIYSAFFGWLKKFDFISSYFWKIDILNFWDQNRKISKIRDSHFVELSILRRLAFFDCVLPQNWAF